MYRSAAALVAACGVVLVGVVGAQSVGAAGNPIQTENAQTGSWDWQRAFASPAPTGSIDGYLGAASAAPGATVTVHGSTSPAATFRVEVFRIGWYAGMGGRLMGCAPDCAGSVQGAPQSTPAPEPGTGRVRANWPVSTSFTVGNDWVSGYYVVNFVLTSGPNSGRATWTPLVVTAPPEREKNILVHASTTTWQAYNNWGGKSLYDYNSTGGRAHKVSFDRPYLTQANTGMYDWEVPFVRWLEREGYDVAYASDIDSHRNTALLQGYRLVLINGHDEYWSTPIRDAFENAKAATTNIASFGANIGYWHIRFEDGERTMVGYKDAALDPNTNPAAETVQFRDLQPPRAECALTGVQYMGGYSSNRTYTIVDAALSDPWMAGTGFAAGSTIPGVVGYEWDTIVTGCTAGGARTTFFQYPGSPPEQLPAAHLTRHVLPSGSIMFSTGTMDWALKLDPWSSGRDARVEVFTRNVLAAMQQQGTNSPPTVSLTAPAGGATVSGSTAVSANAGDDAAVAGVQFKLDGANLGAEDTSSPYGISWDTTSVANGQHTLTAVARDGANLTTTSAPVTVTVSNTSNQPPTVSLTAPAGGATVSGSTAVSANAGDDVSVAGVQFRLDGDEPRRRGHDEPVLGLLEHDHGRQRSHTLTAVARDGANLTTTSAPVTVTVSNTSNQPPTVSLTAPAGGATVSGSTAVSANAGDDVSVAGVQFRLDGANLGAEDTSSPYGISWDTTSVANGSHTLTAVARDGANLTTTSAPVTVTVSNAAPPSGAVLLGAAKSGDNGSSPSLVFNLPAMQAGDQIVVGVQASNDTSFTLPPGWTVVNDFRPTTSWHPRVVVLRRAAVAGESTVTIQTGYIGKTGVAVAYRGLDPTTPVIATTTASVDSTTLTVPGITPGVSGARLAFFTGAQGHSTPTGWSPPAGMTEVGDTNTLQWISIAGHEQLLSSGAATGSRSAVFGGSFSLSGVLVALRPASGPPNAPPTVSITQPTTNATVSGTITVSANASDDTGVAGVQFRLDGANLGAEDTSSPYSVSWDTTAVANGLHTLTAVARDSASQTTTSASITVTVNNVASNQPPTVSVTQPANNATVSGTATVSANANDDTGVAGVQFRLDGTNLGVEDTSAPFTLQWDTTSVANGSHTLTAVARDGPGLTTTSTPITVTVSNGVNQPPTVSITVPASAATVSGTITVTANATDDTGVAGVQFRLDGTNLGVEDTSAPFIRAMEHDERRQRIAHADRGRPRRPRASRPRRRRSPSRSRTPHSTPPTVSITAPASGATVSGTIIGDRQRGGQRRRRRRPVQARRRQPRRRGHDAPVLGLLEHDERRPTASHTLTAVARDAAGQHDDLDAGHRHGLERRTRPASDRLDHRARERRDRVGHDLGDCQRGGQRRRRRRSVQARRRQPRRRGHDAPVLGLLEHDHGRQRHRTR